MPLPHQRLIAHPVCSTDSTNFNLLPCPSNRLFTFGNPALLDFLQEVGNTQQRPSAPLSTCRHHIRRHTAVTKPAHAQASKALSRPLDNQGSVNLKDCICSATFDACRTGCHRHHAKSTFSGLQAPAAPQAAAHILHLDPLNPLGFGKSSKLSCRRADLTTCARRLSFRELLCNCHLLRSAGVRAPWPPASRPANSASSRRTVAGANQLSPSVPPFVSASSVSC